MSIPRDLILVLGLTTLLVACESMNRGDSGADNDDRSFGTEETDPGASGGLSGSTNP